VVRTSSWAESVSTSSWAESAEHEQLGRVGIVARWLPGTMAAGPGQKPAREYANLIAAQQQQQQQQLRGRGRALAARQPLSARNRSAGLALPLVPRLRAPLDCPMNILAALLCLAAPARAARVFTRSVPLVGGPEWLRLHQYVIVAADGEGFAGCPGEDAPPRGPVLFDFLPDAPTELETAVALLAGRVVQGRVRQLAFSSALSNGDVVLRASTSRPLSDLARWADAYPRELVLYGQGQNHCRTFVERFIEFAAGEDI
jgi:hypothetical protein